jgi:hypothetical protein
LEQGGRLRASGHLPHLDGYAGEAACSWATATPSRRR